MTAPLDEARLRESMDRVRAFRARMLGLLLMEGRTLDPLDLDALLDALSAERERGDRAVKVIEDFAQFGVNHTSKWVSATAQDFLATQKTEGS